MKFLKGILISTVITNRINASEKDFIDPKKATISTSPQEILEENRTLFMELELLLGSNETEQKTSEIKKDVDKMVNLMEEFLNKYKFLNEYNLYQKEKNELLAENRLHKVKIKNYEDKIEILQKEIIKYKNERSGYQNTILYYQSENKKKTEVIFSLTATTAVLEKQNHNSNEIINKLGAAIDEYKKEIQKYEENTKKKSHDINKLKDEWLAEKTKYQKEISNKDKKINELEKTIEVLKEEHKKKEEFFNNHITNLTTQHTNEIAEIEKKNDYNKLCDEEGKTPYHIEQKYKSVIEEIKIEHENEIAEIEKKHKEAIAEINEINKANIAILKDENKKKFRRMAWEKKEVNKKK